MSRQYNCSNWLQLCHSLALCKEVIQTSALWFKDFFLPQFSGLCKHQRAPLKWGLWSWGWPLFCPLNILLWRGWYSFCSQVCRLFYVSAHDAFVAEYVTKIIEKKHFIWGDGKFHFVVLDLVHCFMLQSCDEQVFEDQHQDPEARFYNINKS